MKRGRVIHDYKNVLSIGFSSNLIIQTTSYNSFNYQNEHPKIEFHGQSLVFARK